MKDLNAVNDRGAPILILGTGLRKKRKNTAKENMLSGVTSKSLENNMENMKEVRKDYDDDEEDEDEELSTDSEDLSEEEDHRFGEKDRFGERNRRRRQIKQLLMEFVPNEEIVENIKLSNYRTFTSEEKAFYNAMREKQKVFGNKVELKPKLSDRVASKFWYSSISQEIINTRHNDAQRTALSNFYNLSQVFEELDLQNCKNMISEELLWKWNDELRKSKDFRKNVQFELSRSEALQVVGLALDGSRSTKSIDLSNIFEGYRKVFNMRQFDKSSVEEEKENKETMDMIDPKILPLVIPAKSLNVSFKDIGSLNSVKEVLYETVTLPLERPELFARGLLSQPTKGVLLYGPPGIL